MKNTITLKADSFHYPTLEERRKIKEYKPKIDRLTVEHKPASLEILGGSDYNSAVRSEDIYWWCECLNNRLGKMDETFVYVLTHYFRLKENTSGETTNNHTEKILLDYYIEIFYYYFFSTRDVLGQFLNIFYDLKVAEDKIFLNSDFIKKISSEKIKNALTVFLHNTKDSYQIRNSFNHRFTPTQQDLRAKTTITKADQRICFSSAKDVEIGVFITDIEILMKNLSYLMSELKEELK